MSLKPNKENLKKERKNVRMDKLEKGKIIPLKRDFIFTQIFNDENYNFALYQLLSDVLNLNKESFNNNIKYLNRDLKISNKHNMLNKVDLLIKRKFSSINGKKQEEYINVEINTSEIMLDRNKVYSNKIGSFTLENGNTSYKNIDRVVQINFNFFDTNKLRLLAISQLKDQDNIVDKGWKDIYYTISVNLALNSWYNLIDEREKKVANWCILMSTNDLETFKRKAEEIMSKEEADKLTDRLEELSCDRENIALYTKLTNEEMVFNTRLAYAEEEAKEQGYNAGVEKGIEQGIKQGIEKGIEKGIGQGIEQGSKKMQIDIAKNLIRIGLDNNKISESTGLSIKEIESLKEV